MATLSMTNSFQDSETGVFKQVNADYVQVNPGKEGVDLKVATSETSWTPANTPTMGPFMLVNRDTDNFVDVGFATGVYVFRLQPGQVVSGVLNPTITQFFALADTAAVRLEITVYEA